MVDTKRYSMYNVNKTTYGAPEGNIDYQKTSKKNKEQVFTLSYKLNYNPTGYEYESNIDGIFNYDSRRQISRRTALILLSIPSKQTLLNHLMHPIKLKWD